MSVVEGIIKGAEIGAPLLVELVKVIGGRGITEEQAKAALQALLGSPPRDLQLDTVGLAAIAAGGRASTLPPPPISSIVRDAAQKLAEDLRGRGMSALEAAELSDAAAFALREMHVNDLRKGAI